MQDALEMIIDFFLEEQRKDEAAEHESFSPH